MFFKVWFDDEFECNFARVVGGTYSAEDLAHAVNWLESGLGIQVVL